MEPVEAQYIEEVGLAFQLIGLPRMAGRVLGWLMICEPTQQTLDQICQAIAASKASASTMVRVLIGLDLVERTSRPRDRKEYVQLCTGAWERMLAQQVAELRTMRELAERGLALMKGKSEVRRQRLRDMRELYGFFERELPPLLQRWQRWQRGKARA